MPQFKDLKLKVEDSIEINASVQDVFPYFTAADKISKWWSKSAIAEPTQNGKLTFIWENNTELESHFKTFIPFEKLAFPFGPEFVDVTFKTIKNNKTFITVCHSDILIPEANIKNSDFSLLIHITQSWSFLLINLKMVIEHKIDLR